MTLVGVIIAAIISGGVGFFLGTIKFFREEKQKTYRDSLPTIIRLPFLRERTDNDEREFNEALDKLLLYANKEVIDKINIVVALMHRETETKKMIEPFQEAIVAIRNDIHDIQLSSWLPGRKLEPKDIKQFYTTVKR